MPTSAPSQRVAQHPETKAPGAKGQDQATPRGSNRDLIEQIVVAFVAAILFKGFAAEAFVIPTGSMAPTLMGRHKDVTCPECGVRFQVNAADEVEDRGFPSKVGAATCVNCRTPARQLAEQPSFKGDRILVMKFPYDLPFLPGAGGPDRYDVVVFKYPEGPEVNYIKRLVGLPDEEIQILMGDVRARPLGAVGEPFRYPRRPLGHQQAMQMLVWDDRRRPEHLKGKPEWQRWRPSSSGAWDEEPPSGWLGGGSPVFVARDLGSDWNELRYRHLVPDPIQWEAVLEERPLPYPPRATLITDFYSYNSAVPAHREYEDDFDWFAPHWVGDLTVSFRVQAAEATGRLRIELVKGGVPYRCAFDLASGMATLSRGDEPLGQPAATPLRDSSSHSVVFANVDGRLTLWVDGTTPFGNGLVYDDGSDPVAGPTAADLAPVGIAAREVSVRVSDLVLKRDIYYTLQPGPWDFSGLDLRRPGDREYRTPAERAVWIFDVLADPERFADIGRLHPQTFPIRPGHYLMLGDNSPKSKDSRAWGQADRDGYYDTAHGEQVAGWTDGDRQAWEVPRSLIIGKAFYIFWPHGIPVWPRLYIPRIDLYFPFLPDFGRMGWIR